MQFKPTDEEMKLIMDLGNVLEKVLRGTDFLDVDDSEDEEDEEEWSGGDILVE